MSAFTHSVANAELAGVKHVRIEVNGASYSVPVGNEEREQDLYMIKKALSGDTIAREMFLGEKDERYFFIGSDSPLWLRIDRFSEDIREARTR